jgi:hypothetical protein
MGASFTNLHVRSAPTQSVCDALPKITPSRAYISRPSNSWVTVYTEVTEDQDDKKLRAIASELSKTLKADVLAFVVHDSSIAMYWLYRNGTLADEFNSAPEYFGNHVSNEERARVRGNTDALLPLCVDGTTREQLDEVLHPPGGPPTFAEEIIYELAKLLGIDDARASLGFEYFTAEGEEILPDAGDFEPVGKGTEREKSEPDDDDEDEESAGPSAAARGIPKNSFGYPDPYPMGISILTQIWNPLYTTNQQFLKQFGTDLESRLKGFRHGCNQSAGELVKGSTVPGVPTIEELIAARDQGPEALAELIAKETPGQLTEIGVLIATYGLADFLAALLKRGLNPTAANVRGETTLRTAERHGKDSAVYQLVKVATEGK